MKFQKNNEKKTRKPITINTKRHSYYWWALPLIPFCEFYDWAEQKRYASLTWDEKKADLLLNKYILPKTLQWVEDEKAFYYPIIFTPQWTYYNYCPRRYRKWLSKFSWKVQDYLRDAYENPDYIKTFHRDYDEEWIKFEERA